MEYTKNENTENKKKSWWLLTAVGLFLLSKGKSILAVLKMGKIGAPLISMIISIGAYAILFPFQFALGIVLLLLVHELGHVIAAKQKGLPVSAPLFIPFLGALITMKRHPRDAVTEAYIAMGGPILGTLGGLLTYWIGVQWEIPIMIVLANAAFFLNLINLLPIHPLDGGRIVTAVTRWLWLVGLIGGIIVIVYLKSILFFIIWLMFAWDMYQKYVRKRKSQPVTVPFEMETSLERWMATGLPLPGESHQRDLEFRAYSTLDGELKVNLRWDMVGLNEVVSLPQQLLIQQTRITGTKILPGDEFTPERIVLSGEIRGSVYENDQYFSVPVQTRWAFGLTYIGLAGVLGYLLYLCHGSMEKLGML